MINIKHIPNILSVFRIITAILLLVTRPLSAWFFFLYSFCGISDMLDGYIARKLNCVSKLGAILDSLSDFILVAIMGIIFVPLIQWQIWHIGWIVLISIIRFTTLAVSYKKYKEFAFLHSYANKVTGLFLFLAVFAMRVVDLQVMFVIVCIVATVSAVEELAIMIKSKTLDKDVKSIFKEKK